jgi:hypothetical protein
MLPGLTLCEFVFWIIAVTIEVFVIHFMVFAARKWHLWWSTRRSCWSHCSVCVHRTGRRVWFHRVALLSPISPGRSIHQPERNEIRLNGLKQFWGAISAAINWAKREDETDSVEPGQMGRAQDFGRTCRLAATPHQGERFHLAGLVAELAKRGLEVDYRSVWEFVHAEKLSFKKKRGGWRTRSS